MPQGDWSDIRSRLHEVENIPTLPTVAMKTIKIINDPLSDMNDLQVVLRNDPAITTRIMKVANSAYYGLSRSVESLRTALVILGMQEVGRLVNTIAIIQNFPSDQIGSLFNFEKFWSHSACVAEIAQFISKFTNASQTGEVFTAGLLHDIGKLILASCFEEDFIACAKHAQEYGASLIEAEEEMLGVNHCQIGAELIKFWEMSEMFEQVVRYHHTPEKAENHKVESALVYLSGRLCNHNGIGFGSSIVTVDIMDDPAWDILIAHGASEEKIRSGQMFNEMGRLIQNVQLLTQLAIS